MKNINIIKKMAHNMRANKSRKILKKYGLLDPFMRTLTEVTCAGKMFAMRIEDKARDVKDKKFTIKEGALITSIAFNIVKYSQIESILKGGDKEVKYLFTYNDDEKQWGLELDDSDFSCDELHEIAILLNETVMSIEKEKSEEILKKQNKIIKEALKEAFDFNEEDFFEKLKRSI